MDVVGIDYPVFDFLMHMNKLPETNGSARLLSYSWQGGGKVATALVALGRLGVKAGVVGIIGGDPFGRFCLDDFARHGVDTSQLIVDKEGHNAFCVVISERETGGRSIVGGGGKLRRLSAGDLDRDYITSAHYLHLTRMDEAGMQAAKWAKEAGRTVVFDADGYQQQTEDNLQLIDVFIPSEFYFRERFGGLDEVDLESCLREWQECGPKIVVVTLGEKGCAGVSEDGYFEVPAFQVDVVDTTGAGDVFHGAFIYGLLQEWDARRCARFASAVAAIKCTRQGGRAAIPDLPTVERFLRDGTIDYREIDERERFYARQGFYLSAYNWVETNLKRG